MKSNKNFEEFWIEKPNTPYLTGSNTELVKSCASEVYNRFKRKNKYIRLDKYAIESMKRISEIDNSVSFPIQLTIASNQIIDFFPVNEGITSHQAHFIITYP